jgi:hypothetical protein
MKKENKEYGWKIKNVANEKIIHNYVTKFSTLFSHVATQHLD